MQNKRINAAIPAIKKMTDEELGRRFREWFLESDHQGWDGYNSRDLCGLGRAMEDFVLFSQFYIEPDKKEG